MTSVTRSISRIGGQAASAANGGRDAGSSGGSSGSAARGGASGAGNTSGALGSGGTSDASSGGAGATSGTGGSTRDGAAGAGGSAGANCTQNCMSTGLDCCDGRCVNLRNDIQNCGSCGNTCSGPRPFCRGTTCGEPICAMTAQCATGSYCCEMTCCSDAQLCCAHFGGPAGSYFCHTPTAAQPTCPPGCPNCP
jgi:hypothetical protein